MSSWNGKAIRGCENPRGSALAHYFFITPLQPLGHTHRRKFLEPRSTIEVLAALLNETKLGGQFCWPRPRHRTALNAFESLGNVAYVNRDHGKTARQSFLHNGWR